MTHSLNGGGEALIAAPHHAEQQPAQAHALPRLRILSPLASRDFAVLWGGMTVSLLGDGIYFVAVAWEALRLSNTAIAISLVGVAWTLPTVAFLLIGGTLSDRLDRRRLMLTASVVQASAIGAIGVLIVLGLIHLWAMLLLVAIYGAADSFFLPAFEAVVPTIVEPRDLAHASALDQFIRPLAMQLAGPAIGGIVIALAGTGTAFLIDAGTFLVAAGGLLAMRVPARASQPNASADGTFTGISEAIRFVRANPWLSRTLIGASLTLLVFVGPSQVLLPFAVKNVLHAGSGTLGMIRACGGVGGLIAAVTVSQRGLSGWPVRVMLTGWSLQCLMLTAYALAANAWVFGGASLLGGAFGAAGNVVWGTLLKARVPNQMLGRVASLDLLVSIGLIPVSFALTAPVAQVLGAQATLLGAGMLAAATMLLFALRTPTTRRLTTYPGAAGRARGYVRMSALCRERPRRPSALRDRPSDGLPADPSVELTGAEL